MNTNYMMAKAVSKVRSSLEDHPVMLDRINDIEMLRDLFKQRDHEYHHAMNGSIWFNVDGVTYRVWPRRGYGEIVSFDNYKNNKKMPPESLCPF